VTPAPAVNHSCWSYDDLLDFRAHAAEFLSDGVAAGEFTWYVGVDTAPEVTAALGRSGQFVDVVEAYPAGAVIDPAAQVAAYAAATEAALAAGYSGLRVAAEVTGLVGSPAQLDAFARYEFAIGRYMLSAPLRAVCGYDRGVLGGATVAEAACLHPRSIHGATPFHLHPADPATGDVFLDGELDAAAEELFTGALRRIDPARPGQPFVVHADGLRFVDHRSLLVLDRYAERHDATAVLRTRRTAVRHLAELLELGRVRVEVVA
jgi:hypothetical protein